MRTHLLRLLALTSVLVACRAAPVRPAPPALPEVFGPLGWDVTAASLRARFPEASVTETVPDEMWTEPEPAPPRMASEVWATGARLEPFGTVDIRVLRLDGQPVGLVIQRSDRPGDACTGGDEAVAAACFERFERARTAVYDRVAAGLIARYGEGRLEHLESESDTSASEPVDIGQSKRTWELPGMDVELALGLDPTTHHRFMVRLVALRDRGYHFW